MNQDNYLRYLPSIKEYQRRGIEKKKRKVEDENEVKRNGDGAIAVERSSNDTDNGVNPWSGKGGGVIHEGADRSCGNGTTGERGRK